MKHHSVMFHHFKGGTHIDGQGAIDKDQFQLIIDFLKSEFNLIGAQEFQQKALNATLNCNDVTLSFDDGLKCQFDIAIEVLEKNNLDSFFFIYSGIFEGVGVNLEIYRDFRSRAYSSFEKFYDDFMYALPVFNIDNDLDRLGRHAEVFLADHHLYTKSDRVFRYFRDVILSEEQYSLIMDYMMEKENYDSSLYLQKLFMSEGDILNLSTNGHTVGLHSHTHPTMMQNLDIEDQRLEYQKNHEILSQICDMNINSMSHPCGRYSKETLTLLRELGVVIGFGSHMQLNNNDDMLQIRRNDHMNVLRDCMRCK